MPLVVPSHVISCAASSFYLQTLTRPHSLAPKTLFWSNMTRISCTLFQQQTLLITCNVPGQQTTGTVSYCWVKTAQPRSSYSFTQGALWLRNTIWNQNIPQKWFRHAGTKSRQLSFPPSLTCSSPAQLWPSAGFWQGHLSSSSRATFPHHLLGSLQPGRALGTPGCSSAPREGVWR